MIPLGLEDIKAFFAIIIIEFIIVKEVMNGI
jgi:hypothetical protein